MILTIQIMNTYNFLGLWRSSHWLNAKQFWDHTYISISRLDIQVFLKWNLERWIRWRPFSFFFFFRVGLVVLGSRRTQTLPLQINLLCSCGDDSDEDLSKHLKGLKEAIIPKICQEKWPLSPSLFLSKLFFVFVMYVIYIINHERNLPKWKGIELF